MNMAIATTTLLGTPENLGDARVRVTSPGTNFGTETQLFINNYPNDGIGYIMFDITSIPCDTETITGANLSFHTGTMGDTDNLVVHEVNTTSSGGTWNEINPGAITCTNSPCGCGVLSNPSICNNEPEDNVTVNNADDEIWINFSVGTAVQNACDRGSNNASLVFYFYSGIASFVAYSKEGTAGKQPLLYVSHEAAPSSFIKTFTLTAVDTYDDAALQNITVTISNSSFSFSDSVINGSLIVNNGSVPSFEKLYDIDFRVNDSGGYFNRTFLNINISNAGSFEGDLFQSVLKLVATDALNNQSISSFSASVTNSSSDSTTNGQLLILIKEGSYQLNVTADGFDKLVTNFSILTLANNTLNVSMGSLFTFRLIREETNNPFDFQLTNTTDLTIFCPNETIRIPFNMSNNASQIVNCQFTLMQMTVDYGILGSYFRTLIPSFSQKNITWYLIDLLAGDAAIQKVIKLVDLTGDFSDATLTVKRAIPGETILKTMIQQKFDISNEVNLFLVKDALYTINIENAIEDIALGNLIPTEAGTQTITLPKIDFVPQETILGDDVSWSYTFNLTLGILRLQYVDITGLTTFVRFTVRNGSDPNLGQLFLAESNNNATVTMTFNQVIANNTYVSELFFIHPGLSNFTETRPWYEFGGNFGALNLEGWSPSEQITFKNWIAWFFLAVWGMFWSRRYIGIGMTTLVIWMWIFRTLKWIDVSALVFGFVALLAVVGWIVEAIKRE